MITGSTILMFLLWLIVAAVVFYLFNWLLGYIGIEEPFAKVARVVIGVATVLLLVNALFWLTGHPIIKW